MQTHEQGPPTLVQHIGLGIYWIEFTHRKAYKSGDREKCHYLRPSLLCRKDLKTFKLGGLSLGSLQVD